MNTRKIALAVAAGSALMVAAPAFADHRDHGWRGHGPNRHYVQRHNHARYYHRAPAYVYAPRRVVVAPPPYYYAPQAPVYYTPAAPVLYGSVPFGGARVNFGVRF